MHTPETDLHRLAPELDLAAASALRDALVASLDAGRGLELDASAVERISTACLQVLVAAARATQREGLAFRIINPSHVLAGAVADLAILDLLPSGS